MSKLIDISIGLHSKIPVYPGDQSFRFQWAHRIGPKHHSNLSHLSLGSHTGTHIDAPFHFLKKGKRVDQIPLETLNGPCRIVETKNSKVIEAHDLPSLNSIKRILFKTENSRKRLLEKKRFVKDFVALTSETAELLVKEKTQLVGIDYLSIESYGHKEPRVHWTLLKAGIIIVEGLDLSRVSPGTYELICLPLKVTGAEGAPARTILKSY